MTQEQHHGQTITTLSAHGLVEGDLISASIPDRRWWRRLWHFITFRSPPTITKLYRLTSAESATTLGAEEG